MRISSTGHRGSAVVESTWKHFTDQSKEHQLNSDLSAVKGKLLIDYTGQDVICALCCTTTRLCHTNFICPMNVQDKQYGQKL